MVENFRTMIKPELTSIAKTVLEHEYKSNEPEDTLTPIQGGEWSAAYRFSYCGQEYVIRLSHTPDNFYRDKAASQWSSPSLPIPQIIRIDCCKDQYFAISPFFPGVALESLPFAELEQAIPGLLSMLSALQSVDLSTIEGFGTLTPEGKGAFHCWTDALLDVNNDRPDSLTHGWRAALTEFPEWQCKFERFYEELTKLVRYCPEHKHLIHSDLLYQNLLVDNRNISAVLDWGCAMVGDPLYDYAMFAFFEPWFPAFTQVGLVQKLERMYLLKSPGNCENFRQRVLACQIHVTLGNIAYCALIKRHKDLQDHINRLDDVLRETS